MTINKQRLRFSELITEMRNIIHNNGRFCFSDFTWDMQMLAFLQEKMNDFIQYWAVRENGTIIADSAYKVKNWAQSCKCQGIYKITFEHGLYSFESIEIR